MYHKSLITKIYKQVSASVRLCFCQFGDFFLLWFERHVKQQTVVDETPNFALLSGTHIISN